MLAKDDILFPDSIRIIIKWDEMRVGGSVFVPCMDTITCKAQIQGVAERRGWEVKAHTCEENGLWGVRMWRMS